jgi:hypothetical protein
MVSDKTFHIIMTVVIVGFILYGIIYWFGGQRVADNLKDESYTWTQNAIVMGKTTHWWGDSCLLDADDGKRYYDESCSNYIDNDKVIIVMYKDHYRWIKGVI